MWPEMATKRLSPYLPQGQKWGWLSWSSLDYPLAFFKGGVQHLARSSLWCLPQAPQPFKDDREWPQSDISQLTQHPQTNPVRVDGQDSLGDLLSWTSSGTGIPLLLDPCLWAKMPGNSVSEDWDEEGTKYFSFARICCYCITQLIWQAGTYFPCLIYYLRSSRSPSCCFSYPLLTLA